MVGPVEISARLVRGALINTTLEPRATVVQADMQSSFVQTINALLQQFQQPQPMPGSPPQIPPVDALRGQLLQSIQTIDHSIAQQPGLAELLQSLQRQAPQSTSTPIPPSQLLSDALKIFAPVGQSPNDEQLLVMALHSGLAQGLDHRRAIEALHGVCSLLHVLGSPLNPGSRSTTTPPIYGKIITSNINLA
jgi:hypothetical protein